LPLLAPSALHVTMTPAGVTVFGVWLGETRRADGGRLARLVYAKLASVLWVPKDGEAEPFLGVGALLAAVVLSVAHASREPFLVPLAPGGDYRVPVLFDKWLTKSPATTVLLGPNTVWRQPVAAGDRGGGGGAGARGGGVVCKLFQRRAGRQRQPNVEAVRVAWGLNGDVEVLDCEAALRALVGGGLAAHGGAVGASVGARVRSPALRSTCACNGGGGGGGGRRGSLCGTAMACARPTTRA